MQVEHPLSRRQLLAAGGLGLAAVTLGQQTTLQAADDEIAQGDIDAHSHIWTRDVKTYPLADNKTVADLKPPSFTAEELIATAEAVGVTRVVLIGHGSYYKTDNSYLIAAAKQYPQRFRVVAIIDDTADRPDQLMRELLTKRCTGFRINPGVRGKNVWLDGPGMASMWKTGAETGQAMCCLINPSDIPGVAKMCAKYPDTPVVIDHFARVGVSGTIEEDELKLLLSLAKFPRVRVKLSAYYALGKKQPPYLDLLPMVKRVVDAYGPKRLMWASDAPYQVVPPNTYRASVELARNHFTFLNDDERDCIMRRTAEETFYFDA